MARYAVFEVNLDAAQTKPVVVTYKTKDGTATAARGDYTPASGVVTFPAGSVKQEVLVRVRDEDTGRMSGEFTLELETPVNGQLGTKKTATMTLEGDLLNARYFERFNIMYEALHDKKNLYFGPSTGPEARQFTVPKHISGKDSKIINEAPDYGGETVSETASFWVGLEAWKGYLSEDWSGFNNCWTQIDKFYVPSEKNAPFGKYDPSKPADYTPEGVLPSQYPRLGQPSAPKGQDPLWAELQDTYGSDRMHLMHWIIDVDGDYGFKNGDGMKTNVFINTYERGLQESSYETVTHPCWNDWKNGGGTYGFEPLYTQGKQLYPAAEFDYGKKWSYTSAPDSEIRAIQWSFWAAKFAAEQGKSADIANMVEYAKKVGDYGRYFLFDKYFRVIGNNQSPGTGYDSCHYLVNWYVAWGGEIPLDTTTPASWGYAVGCSECHHGYQGLSTAYALAKGGGGMVPDSPTAGDVWLKSLRRTIEMIRWLQSPEGPIAGGVTNSWLAQYATPDDGRELAKFYGMVYTYSPVWHDPPSNNWVGFQGWGQGRTADLFLEVSDKTTPLAEEVRPQLEVILDRLVTWFVPLIEYTDAGSFKIPSDLEWVSAIRVAGQTTSKPNLEGVFEFLPTMNWNGAPSGMAAFWDATTVPNPTLHSKVRKSGLDLGVAASMAYLLTTYAEAKRRMGKFEEEIPNAFLSTTKITAKDCYVAARRLLDRSWKNWDGMGIAVDEDRADYVRMVEEVYIPSNPRFTGTMPNGDIVQPGSTFVSIRSFLKDDPKWPEVEAFIQNPTQVDPPIFRYHRFWAQAEFAISCAAMHRYFGDINDTIEYTP